MASIRVSEREDIPSFGPGLRDGILTATRATLRRLLSRSYELTDPQVIGPEWLDTMRFDIIAKSPEGVPDSAMAAMLRALVKERFRLAAHLETRTAPVYHLAVAPGGVKMPLYPERNPLESDPAARGSGTMGGAGTPAQIANILSSILGRPVIDKTGLTDRYRYFAYFAPYPPRPDTNLPEFRPPDIFTAIQKQMGLELRSAKDAISVLVVDHMERLPTPN